MLRSQSGMWISALLVGACVVAVVATDTCSINDFSSCGIPDEDDCPSLNRHARSAKYSYHNQRRSYRPPRRQSHRRVARDVDSLSFLYDDDDYQEGDDNHHPHTGVRSYREVQQNDGLEDSISTQPAPQANDFDLPHHDRDAQLMREAHAKVCPHCNQALPAEMFHHPPVDPRVFRQFQQYPHLVHPFVPAIIHPHFNPTEDDGEDTGFGDDMETQLTSPILMNQSVPMMFNPAWTPVPMVPPGVMVAPGLAPNSVLPPIVPPPPAVVPPMHEVPIIEEPQGSTPPS